MVEQRLLAAIEQPLPKARSMAAGILRLGR
jgi:hypothetical protein